ncbi:hypothetical protein Sa4125_10350 [Aureimonas sp. SA4125]|uniref:hypothetical protein n=1 Tax=Aureimonas sp. SA4125 TaxID=2826993 RepID=UPI001CC6A16F|nr:hypothetical protein [Aureimonas sp. SA4125]BDA83493.1 hypothetical protein Sa4125_10350 [Aureimonas sp. SA4125]
MQAKERTAKVRTDDAGRSIRIPADVVLEGDEAMIRQDTDGAIIIEPTAPLDLLEWLLWETAVDTEVRGPIDRAERPVHRSPCSGAEGDPVTAKVREFTRVPDLIVENWLRH